MNIIDRIVVQKGQLCVIIVSNSLVDILARITGFNGVKEGNRAMGFTILPCFIILRGLSHPMTSEWINHERIHIRQFTESVGILWIISKIEYLYYRIAKGLSHVEAYRMEAIEQEAYLNQHDKSYLSKRKPFRTLYHIYNKVVFSTDSNYKVVINKTNY